MTARSIVVVLALSLLAGCAQIGESRFNPFNWGRGGDAPDTLVPVDQRIVIDNRPLVSQVTGLALEPTPGGLIVRATGQAPGAGFWQGDLVPDRRDGAVPDGVMAFQFRVAPPPAPQPAPTARSREIVVATFISDQQLRGVREVRIIGAGNSRGARR